MIVDYINAKPIKVVKKIDLATKKIQYSGIIQHRDITTITGEEELVRAYLLTKLVNDLGYSPSNIEIEKEYTAGRPITTHPRADIIVRNKAGDAFLFIELKSRDDFVKDQDQTIESQLFGVAGLESGLGSQIHYLVLFTFDLENTTIGDNCILIDYSKFSFYSKWEETRESLDTLPASYGKAIKEPYVKGSKKDLIVNYSGSTLDSIRTNLHNVLWGGGSSDDNDIFSSLTNIILAKIQDESEKRSGEKYDFQIFAFADENAEQMETNEELYKRINYLYLRALKQRLYITDSNVLSEARVIERQKFSLSKLKYAVQQLEKYSFVDGKNSLNGKDILGDFFEGIIRTGFKQSKGQFFTHINIVKFCLWGLQTDKLAIKRINRDLHIPYMIDPSAGSGTFLIEYMKFITENIKYRFNDKLDDNRDIQDKFDSWFKPDRRENRWAQEFIYGSEINFNLGTATKVNMILHGDGSTNIFVKDGLLSFDKYLKETAPNALNAQFSDVLYNDKEVNGQFDLILTNPPFSVELDNDTKKQVKNGFIFGEKKNSENLFIERYYQLLREKGRMAIVLPESVFDTGENKYIRLFLYKYFNIKAIVSLPQTTFEPFTSTKTSILFAEKKTQEEVSLFNIIWTKYSSEYGKLRTRCLNIQSFIKGEKDQKSLPSIAKMSEEDMKTIIYKILGSFFCEKDKDLSLDNLFNKYESTINDVCSLDKDLKDSFGMVNSWWVFSQVSKELNYSIFMCEVGNIGYKRTKRGEKLAPNELYRTDDKGNVIVDDGIHKTALDYLRDLTWGF